MLNKGQGVSQRTCINDPGTQATEWELTEGGRVGLNGREQSRKKWDIYNKIKKN